MDTTTAVPTRAQIKDALTRDGHTPSKLIKSKRYDDYSLGFWVSTSKVYDYVRVEHKIGGVSVARHPDPDGSLTAAALDRYTATLVTLGYAVERSGSQLRVRNTQEA